MSNKKRFFTDNYGANRENELIAWLKACEIAQELPDVSEITILIHSKKNTGYIERVFGREYINGLFKGTVIAYDDGPRVKMETMKTFPSSRYRADSIKRRVLLSYGLTSKELFLYDKDITVVAMVAHQWATDEVKEWASAWNVTDLITGRDLIDEDIIDPVIAEAFKALTSVINMTTGIAHSSDNNRCKTYLRALHKYNYNLDSVQIKRFLVTKLDWEGRHADDVIKLVDTLNDGRYFRGGERTGLKHYIKIWKSRLE